MQKVVCHLFGVAALFMVLATMAVAQNRTWVSGVGDDANPCSRTAPCRTFAGAQSKTAAGGEISVIDPGSYGAITITKALTIDGGTGSGFGAINISGTSAININAPSNAVVILRNLSINGVKQATTPGISGVRFLAGASLHIENCKIFGFSVHGVDVNLQAAGNLTIQDTTIEEVGFLGVSLSTTTGVLGVTMNRVKVLKAQTGAVANSNAVVTIRDSIFGSSTTGVQVTNGQINLDNCLLVSNTTGVSIGVGTTARMTNNVFANNQTGVDNDGTGVSAANNRFKGNGADRTGAVFVAAGVQ